MCRRATCRTCSKATWKGCGQHVEQVLGNVPVEERCQCAATAGVSASAEGDSRGLLRRLFG